MFLILNCHPAKFYVSKIYAGPEVSAPLAVTDSGFEGSRKGSFCRKHSLVAHPHEVPHKIAYAIFAG